MVAIISEDRDKTTDMVLEWLAALKVEAKRLNFNAFSEIAVHLGNDIQEIRTANTVPEKIWIRRGRLQCVPDAVRHSPLYSYIKKEERPLIAFHEVILKEIAQLTGSSIEERFNNKIVNLHLAKKCGLLIPDTLITNTKHEAIGFFEKHKRIISKCSFHPPHFNTEASVWNSAGTFIVEKEQLDFLADNFSPTLFQDYIEKAYEVRVFFYENNFYAMAILSQEDEKTSIDFRNYNHEKPNRTVPFKLPCDVLSKLQQFIAIKKMDTGSIDLIVTPDNEFVFLEVNPQGQFHWLSLHCNYYIERDIALRLSEYY